MAIGCDVGIGCDVSVACDVGIGCDLIDTVSGSLENVLPFSLHLSLIE